MLHTLLLLLLLLLQLLLILIAIRLHNTLSARSLIVFCSFENVASSKPRYRNVKSVGLKRCRCAPSAVNRRVSSAISNTVITGKSIYTF